MFPNTLPVMLVAGTLLVSGVLLHSVDLRSQTALPASVRAIGSAVRGCGALELTERELGLIDRLTSQAKLRRGLTADIIAQSAANLGTIQVWFHVITDSSGAGDLSDEEVGNQMAVLNDAFENLQFDLVGITRTSNDSWFHMTFGSQAEFDAKSQLGFDTSLYLNIYSAAPDYLGWATFPWDQTANPERDGVVIDYRTLPGNEDLWAYGEGDTATHEVGHWVGLLHTFAGNCSPTGDRVADTPAERTASYGCPSKKDTCPRPGSGLDPIENYMDYSDDACLIQFTSGQYTRMAEQLLTYRPNALIP